MNKPKKAKPKAKPKPRTWKMEDWVAVPTEELKTLDPGDLGNACRDYLCGNTKAVLFKAMRCEGVSRKTHTPLELDIIATER